jgi:hydroxymethylglutaryl-CoA synthase
MSGLLAYGTYVPYWRLDRREIGATLGLPSGRGTRAVASYDEDALTMGVEAARETMRSAQPGIVPDLLTFSTASPPYMEKTNAAAIHAALALPRTCAAYDFGGATRSFAGALRCATSSPLTSLVVAADVRTGLAGGSDEADGGDAAAGFLMGDKQPIADVLATTSATAEFLDRWRDPRDSVSNTWEERFGETVYRELAQDTVTAALAEAGISLGEVDTLIVCGTHARAAQSVAAATGVARENLANNLIAVVGNPGSAQPGLLLADALDRALPGQVIVLVQLADGADVTVLRTTDALTDFRLHAGRTVQDQLAAGRADLRYASYLTWRGLLRRELPRRPYPSTPSAPVSSRHDEWKFAFTASTCRDCGTRHLPPARICYECHSVNAMDRERLADLNGTVATFTIDRLAFTESPPVISVVVDLDGGGRFTCELTDAHPDEVAVGARVAMTFRRIYTAENGVHNYFWKARPAREERSA